MGDGRRRRELAVLFLPLYKVGLEKLEYRSPAEKGSRREVDRKIVNDVAGLVRLVGEPYQEARLGERFRFEPSSRNSATRNVPADRLGSYIEPVPKGLREAEDLRAKPALDALEVD
jgi:hypothetical protein